MKRIIYQLQIIKSSFWFLPLILIISGVVLAIGSLYLDTRIGFDPSGVLQYVFSGSAGSARSVLSLIGGAMIGIAGTVFSITLVVLTLASSQFGPRLLRNFMYNRLNQTVLGIYVSTFLYCLIILNSVKGNEEFSFVPTFSILFALILTVICIICLILFIHQVSMSIQPSEIISAISLELEKNIEKTFAHDLEMDDQKGYEDLLAKMEDELPIVTNISNTQVGYLQYIDNKPLLEIAENHDLLFYLKFKPGEYLVKEAIAVKVSSEREIDDSTKKEIQALFITANNKTTFQDIEFSIDQIVEIACKALSPGINDPFTAITCVDYLTSNLCHMTTAKFPPKYIKDSTGQVRIISKPLTFSGMLDAAFNQIRQFGSASPAVMIRLMEALNTICDFTTNSEQKKAVERHAKMVLEAGKSSFLHGHDYVDLKNRYEDAPFLSKVLSSII